jgi:hypothetical protein
MKKKMSSAEMTKKLSALENPALVRLIQELARNSEENRIYIMRKLCAPADTKKRLEHYKRMIKEEFFSDDDYLGHLDLRMAKYIISDYLRETGDADGALELRLHYVEMGTRYTNKYGDIDERFYISMETAFGEVVDELNRRSDAKLIARFRPRLEKLVRDTEDIGWGYHDGLCGMMEELEERR